MKILLKFTLVVIFLVVIAASPFILSRAAVVERTASAEPSPTPTAEFDQKAALAKLKEQIKGRENEPAEKVFKNLTTPTLRTAPAARLLAIMEFGYARSLGVNCTHCHVPDKWESEDKPQKQITRDMSALVAKLNGEMLNGIKNLSSPTPTVNCTTCHRGEVKPALNLPMPAKS